MSNIPQSPRQNQPEKADIALPDGSAPIPIEGELIVSLRGGKGGRKAGTKARSGTPPQDTRIAELKKQIDEQKRAALHRVLTTLEGEKKIVKLECELAQAQAQAETNARIAQEENEDRQSILAENTSLRSTLAETETRAADLHRQLTTALKRIAHLEELYRLTDDLYQDMKEREDRQKRLIANDEIEALTKLAILYCADITRDKGNTYTPVYTGDVARALGINRQAAGRHLNKAVEWNVVSAYRTEEKATVADARLGTREITKKILNIAPTDLLEHPEDIKRLDGKSHGGSLPRCHRCNGENTLRKIHHTVCLSCGHEDILMPDDARMALDKARPIGADDAPAAVAEAVAIFTQTAPPEAAPVNESKTTEVHLELQSEPAQEAMPDITGEIMTTARRENWPALTLPSVQIDGNESAWSRWMWMSHTTDKQIASVHSYLVLKQPTQISEPKTSEVHLELQSEPAAQAGEEEETPQHHTTRMARIVADIWSDIEAKDPGCWIPASVIATWASQGRAYTVLKPYDEPAPVAKVEQTATPAHKHHKAIDFTNGRIIEVQE